SRSAARQREFALRTALGAARGRIVRQVLTESVVLALVGGALGVGIAVAGVRLLVTLQRGAPRVADSHVNTPVLLFALGVSLLTGLLFGLAPALQSGSAQLKSALKEGGRGTSGGASLQRTRAALTVAEVALAVVLLAGSRRSCRAGANGRRPSRSRRVPRRTRASWRCSTSPWWTQSTSRRCRSQSWAGVTSRPVIAPASRWWRW